MKTIVLPVGKIVKLPEPSEDGATLYALVLSTPLKFGPYLVLTAFEMDEYLVEDQPPPPPPAPPEPKPTNESILAGLVRQVGDRLISDADNKSQVTMDFIQAPATKPPPPAPSTKVLTAEEQEIIKLRAQLARLESHANEPAPEPIPEPPDIFSSLPDLQKEMMSNKTLSNIVRMNDEAVGSPYTASRTDVDQMVKYLIVPTSRDASPTQIGTIEARKRQIMRILCGMTAKHLSSVQDLMPKELRATIAQYKMASLGEDPVTGVGANYVPPTWSAFIEGENQGDEVYSIVSGTFRFHEPRLRNETADARDVGNLVNNMPMTANELRGSFGVWLESIKATL